MSEQEEPAEEIIPAEMQEELAMVRDLLDVSAQKPRLQHLALLYAIMVLEKGLRIVLRSEYKSIAKIKFSVLIDKAQQRGFFSAETAAALRILKDHRNAAIHQAQASGTEASMEKTVVFVLETTETVFVRFNQLKPEDEG